MLALVREKGPAGGGRRNDSEASGRAHAPHAAGGRRTRPRPHPFKLGRRDRERDHRAHDARRFHAALGVDSRADADRRRRAGHDYAARAQRADVQATSRAPSTWSCRMPATCRTSSSPTPSTPPSHASSSIGYSRASMRFQISDFRFQIGVALAAGRARRLGRRGSGQYDAGCSTRRSTCTCATGSSTTARSGATARVSIAYVSAIGGADVAGRPRDEQIAFWLNAYNAIVLKTVIDHYPTAQRFKEYPARSIRQVPGAFERNAHRVAGKSVTLDQIEQTSWPEFDDPRVFLALGRGRSAAAGCGARPIRPRTLERQLAEVANECATRAQCVEINKSENEVRVSSIFSWRQKEFAAAYADKAEQVVSPREAPSSVRCLPSSRRGCSPPSGSSSNEPVQGRLLPFDWTLNDLTGRGR